ncbi:MAG: alpha/beta hydrolase-fold protein [Eubacteriales bacterium]|nr:alpha/beta hydrolase-fold protein [Eubacteriales bacterium]
MRSKKVLLLAMLTAAIISLSGCGRSAPEDAPVTAVADTAETAEATAETAAETAAGGATEQAESALAENDTVPDEYVVPDELKPIPDEYLTPNEHKGHVFRVDYAGQSYDEEKRYIQKRAYVYLPYGYEIDGGDKRYNVLYLMHAGQGSAESLLGGESGSTALKQVLDNMIENGDIEPLLVVTPSFYNGQPLPEGELAAGFSDELINDLVPVVESHFRTYAASTSEEDLKASREHRAFGGFSMGSVTTWYVLKNYPEYFKYYLPMSGESWMFGFHGQNETDFEDSAAALHEAVSGSGIAPEDFSIYVLTGTEDVAVPYLTKQVEAMLKYSESFIYGSSLSEGNLCYKVEKGGKHGGIYKDLYIYNALLEFWR